MWWFRRYDAFISYSHKDAAVVKPLIDLLSVNQQRVFWDGDLKPGDDWDAEIQKALKRSGIFVLFWCCDTSQSKEVAKEIATAVRHNKKIVPVKLCPAALPGDLNRWQWVDLQSHVHHTCLALVHGTTAAPRQPAPSFGGASEYTRMMNRPPLQPQPVAVPAPAPPAPAPRARPFVVPAAVAACLVAGVASITYFTFGRSAAPTESAGASTTPPTIAETSPPPVEPAELPTQSSPTYIYAAIVLAVLVLSVAVIRRMRRSRSGKAFDLTMRYLENLGR